MSGWHEFSDSHGVRFGLARIAGRAAARLFLFMALAAAAGCTTADTLSLKPTPLSDSPRYAAIIIDAKDGDVLHQVSANERRYPASLTKMMTLYLLFDTLKSGQLTLQSSIPISVNAASTPPSKLGVSAGDAITIDTAIRALAVKSANDVAVAVAEALAGSEDRFAAQMTQKARALGMNATVFRNASGLPDDAQVTTARDMALLALALRAHFPQYYHYFSLTEFDFRGRTVRGHNHLLGKVAGVDGLKTGYTRASGFNLATSAHRNGRFVVAVILGEDKAKERDAHMVELIDRYIQRASWR